MKTLKSAVSFIIVLFVILTSLQAIAQDTKKHTVKPGETFYHIATEYGVKVSDLQKANPSVGSSYAIHAGQELVIPSSSTKTPAAATTKAAPEKKVATTEKTEKPVETKPVATPGKTEVTAEGTVVALPTRGYHVVKAKETLATLSHDFGVSIADLKKWNDLTGEVKPGMKLKVVDLDAPAPAN